MFQRIFIHIGSGKTATSTIQGTFTRNTELLAREKLYYATRPIGVLSAVRKDPCKLAPVRAAGMASDEVQRVAETEVDRFRSAAADGRYRTAVLSSEHMLPFDEEEVRSLKALLAPLADDIRVLYYARHPYSKIASAYAQRVKAGHCGLQTDLRKFVEPFSRQLRHWITVFGLDQVVVRAFEIPRMPSNDPVADFCAAVGVPGVYPELELYQANDGISKAAVLVADQLYKHYPIYSEGRGPREYLNAIVGSKFTVAPEEILSLRPIIDRELGFLEQNFGIRLSEPSLKPHTDDRNVVFSDEVVESMALALNDQAAEIERLRQEIKELGGPGKGRKRKRNV